MAETTNVDFNPSGSEQVDTVKKGFLHLENTIRMNTPSGRRQSLALTHLETAAMYAVKSIFEP